MLFRSSMDAIPRKRPRRGSTTPGPKTTAGRERDDEFWFEDGSIVLVAENVEFKIYKGLLSERSSVFRDMFSLPQPTSENGETLKGCPEVTLADRAQDVRELLHVVMPKGDARCVTAVFLIASSDIMPFQLVCSCRSILQCARCLCETQPQISDGPRPYPVARLPPEVLPSNF